MLRQAELDLAAEPAPETPIDFIEEAVEDAVAAVTGGGNGEEEEDEAKRERRRQRRKSRPHGRAR